MAWLTTDDGRKVNTEWFDEDERKKYAQIEKNQQEAAERNGDYKEEAIKGTPMIYATAIQRGKRVIIDGYSNKKTEKGALQDLAKAVEKYDKGEADGIRDMIKFDEIQQFQDDNFGIEWQEVSHAVKPNNNGEDEYKEAKWYLHIYFWRK